MPTDPLQLTLVVLEYTLIVIGGGLLLWLLSSHSQRTRWLRTYTLPALNLTLAEFAMAGFLIFMTGFAFTAVLQLTLGSKLATLPDHTGVQLFVYSAANYTGALVGWKILFPSVQRMWEIAPVTPPRPARQILPWSNVGGFAVGTVLVALPLLTLISLGWTELLRVFGISDAPQDLIALFTATKSPFVVAGMLIVACVLAPIYEELIFRAGLYRYVRQRIGRMPALVISGVCFGALHANWAGFLPLAVLGVLLAIVYEATGSIRVVIVAHGLFNLNTIILLLSGLAQANP